MNSPIDPSRPMDPLARSATVVLKCPTCKKHTPHHTRGVQSNAALGELTQGMECAVCSTYTDVATGSDGSDFQRNVDTDDGTDLDTSGVDEVDPPGNA
jgi:hypothetical protein